MNPAPLSPEQETKLRLLRSRGRQSFIIRYGILTFGFPFFVSMSLFGVLILKANPVFLIPIFFVLSLVGGYFYGSWIWKNIELRAFPLINSDPENH